MQFLIPEGFISVQGHPGYLVNEEGVVISFKHGRARILKQWINSNGYLTTKIDNKHYPIHRLIAHNFLLTDISEFNLTINHKDGNKLNNRLINLEFMTIKENVLHAKRNGKGTMPEVNVIGTSLTPPYTSTMYISQAEAAKQTGAKQGNINKCIMGLRQSAGGYAWRKY